jgi:hypothetical protein
MGCYDMLAFRASPYDYFIYGKNDLDASYDTLIPTIHGQPARDARRRKPWYGRDGVMVVAWQRPEDSQRMRPWCGKDDAVIVTGAPTWIRL